MRIAKAQFYDSFRRYIGTYVVVLVFKLDLRHKWFMHRFYHSYAEKDLSSLSIHKLPLILQKPVARVADWSTYPEDILSQQANIHFLNGMHSSFIKATRLANSSGIQTD